MMKVAVLIALGEQKKNCLDSPHFQCSKTEKNQRTRYTSLRKEDAFLILYKEEAVNDHCVRNEAEVSVPWCSTLTVKRSRFAINRIEEN